ncbi:MAG: acyl-CoA desaturase [Bacteroidota bacterium]
MEKQLRAKPQPRTIFNFAFIHLLPLFAIWTGATAFDWFLCGLLYFGRMFFITGGYHRYFSHRTYSTSRAFQFVLAFCAQTSVQKGALWWAAHHREHHKHSDTPEDPHSSKVYGFWYSHIGWIMGPEYKPTLYHLIPDLAKFRELSWLNKYHLVPGLVLMLVVWFVGGWVNGGSAATAFSHGVSSMLIGFFLSTAILFHGTFSINSLMHMIGKQRYKVDDESRNSLVLALVTLGEGWHNNHHYYQASARNGFFWWEIDITYYGLKVFSWLGLVWDLRPVPQRVKDARIKPEKKSRLKQQAA